MNCILLLGAGFSRNWGGRLATEVRAELQSVLRTDQYLARLVQQRDFETALSIVQGEYDQRKSPETQQRLRTMENAISGVFGRMNAAFMKRPSMEFGNDVAFSIRKYSRSSTPSSRLTKTFSSSSSTAQTIPASGMAANSTGTKFRACGRLDRRMRRWSSTVFVRNGIRLAIIA